MKSLIFMAACALLSFQTMTAAEAPEPYSVRMMNSEMLRNPEATWLDGRQGKLKWNYTTGLELLSFLDVAERYDLPYAVEYVKDWADTMADGNGKVATYKKENYCANRTNYYISGKFIHTCSFMLQK